MRGIIYGIGLQWKIDFRNKDVLIMYYIMPIMFFLFMGGIFASTNPNMKRTLIYAMTIFAMCAGGLNGTPASIAGFYSGDIRKAYKVGGIPFWTVLMNSFISALIHLTIVSLIISILSPLLFGADSLENTPRYLMTAVVFTFTTVAIGLLLGLFVKKQSRLSMFTIMCFLPSIMLSGTIIPFEFLPKTLRIISNFVPARWAYMAMTGENVMQNILLLLAVFVMAVVAMLIRLKVISIE